MRESERERERERERESAEQGDTRNRIENRCFTTLVLKLVNSLESLESRFICAPLDIAYAQTATLHTNIKKLEITINNPLSKDAAQSRQV